ncbi:Grap2 and cyclin-D-interacting-domain-containing protein [Phascolomyces articulosus]|uniref:Grap2 and cyclin-D-interacting-domain-containing protein n=1 Tax=Phascolomyces articulosus TaxID=60185 RepID=A0AAD5PDI5_9FUNG|nr:Grap2 and cyclin-D-interacting-domain-containing protein [Phascolomyces articulosus]
MAETYLSDLKTDRPVDNPEFESKQMNDTMAKLGKILSHDATKLTIACKPPRKPSDGIKMISEISNTFYRLLGFYHTIPIDKAGKAYKESYRAAIRDALLGQISLCNSFITATDKEDPSKKKFMVPTAVLWETCKLLESQMPADNRAAVLKQWKSMQETISDAKSEVHEVADGNATESGFLDEDESEDEMSPEQIQVAKLCAQLVDLIVFLFVKVERRCIREADMSLCDELAEAGHALTDETDVLVSQLYDSEPDAIRSKYIKEYVDKALALIKIAQKISLPEEHSKWFEMCSKKLNDLATKKD